MSLILNLFLNNNGTNIINILDTRYTKSEVDNLVRNIDLNMFYTQIETQTIYFEKRHTTTNYYDKATMGSMIFLDSYAKSETDSSLKTKYLT